MVGGGDERTRLAGGWHMKWRKWLMKGGVERW